MFYLKRNGESQLKAIQQCGTTQKIVKQMKSTIINNTNDIVDIMGLEVSSFQGTK